MKILFLSAEASPYVKVGGLGDVAGALPAALRRRGHDVRLYLPAYGLLDRNKLGLTKCMDSFNVKMDWRQETCQVWMNPRTGDRFITNHYFFDNRFQVYGCGDEVEQFVLFCRAALEACRLDGWEPDIIHSNDWHTAAAIRLAWAQDPRPGLVFTIHNMAHQGNQYPNGWPLLGVYDGTGAMNLMQQAIFSADMVTTVSPTYAKEILTREGGCGLDGDLRAKGDRVRGVLNGLDMVNYDPSTDRCLVEKFNRDNWKTNKAICKKYLQDEMGLERNADAPLIGMVSRLDFQKGIEMVIQVIDRIVDYSNAQIMILGSGDRAYEQAIQYATQRHPGRVANFIGYDDPLARQVYAGSDIFLMPSKFEPCGLSQLIAMRYGTLPVARATGGLRDTIVDMRSTSGGCGYLFNNYDKEEMMYVLFECAFKDYNTNRAKWNEAVTRAMSRDFSWDVAAESYDELYQIAMQH